MDSVERLDWNPIPKVSPVVAAGFDNEHGTPDEAYTDEMLRRLAAANPEFVKELDTVANRVLSLYGFDAKVRFLEGGIAAAGLLISQGDTDILRRLYEEHEDESDKHPAAIECNGVDDDVRTDQEIEEQRKSFFEQFMERRQERRLLRQVHRGIAAAFILSKFSNSN